MSVFTKELILSNAQVIFHAIVQKHIEGGKRGRVQSEASDTRGAESNQRGGGNPPDSTQQAADVLDNIVLRPSEIFDVTIKFGQPGSVSTNVAAGSEVSTLRLKFVASLVYRAPVDLTKFNIAVQGPASDNIDEALNELLNLTMLLYGQFVHTEQLHPLGSKGGTWDPSLQPSISPDDFLRMLLASE